MRSCMRRRLSRARSGADRRSVAARERRAVVAQRARGAARSRDDAALNAIKGWVADSGEGRWTVQEAIDLDVPGAGDHAVAADALPLAADRLVRREGHRGAAQRVRRPCGEALMSAARAGRFRASDRWRCRPIDGAARARRSVHDGDLRRDSAISVSASCCRRIYQLMKEHLVDDGLRRARRRP